MRAVLRALAAGADARRRHAALQDVRLRRLVPVSRRAAGDGGPRRGAMRTGRLPDRVAERRADGRPVVGAADRGGDRGAGDRGAGAVVVCSAGFVADHLEILYDLDIEARADRREGGRRGSCGHACRTPTRRTSTCSPRSCASTWRRCRRDERRRPRRRDRGRGRRPDDGVPAGRGRCRRHRARSVRTGGRQARHHAGRRRSPGDGSRFVRGAQAVGAWTCVASWAWRGSWCRPARGARTCGPIAGWWRSRRTRRSASPATSAT